MIYLPLKIGQIIGTCTKAASTSLSNQIRVPGTKGLSNLAVIEMKKAGWSVTGLIRDPIDRLESAYNFFQYGQCGRFPNGKAYDGIGHFIDSVLSGDSDQHWMPQTEQLVLCDNFVDLMLFPLDIFDNSCEHKERVNYRITDLKLYYAGDYGQMGNAWRS